MQLATCLANRYELQTELSPKQRPAAGRKTFLAKDTHTQETVVVKIIQPAAIQPIKDLWRDRKLFQRETDVLATLDHPAIPKYKDAFEVDIAGSASFVLVQTHIEAVSLESLIQSGRRFSESEVLVIATRLLRILQYLHTQSPPVIHRDIKPSNILISTSPIGELGDIYLIDFGAVHTDLSKEDGTITIVGSFGYIPLEQFSGHTVPASDLYSLGMTLISLITGLHPGDMDTVKGELQLTQLAISPAFITWLKRMTHPYLHQRFESAENALRVLQAKSGTKCQYPHLKPEGTSIELERERDRIQITLDSLGTETRALIRAIHVLSTLGILALFFKYQVPFAASIMPFLMLQLVIHYLLAAFPKRFPNIGAKTIIKIDRRHQDLIIGTLRNPNKPVNWECQTSKDSRFDLLAYNPGYRFKTHTKGDKVFSQSGGGVPPKLSLHSGPQSYTIGHHRLSPAELWWLGQELGDFLGLELQTIYPMPIVTVSNTATCGC